MNNFYEVQCKCGHVGKKYYISISFPVKAKNGKEAAKIAKEFPRVKYDKNSILSVKKITIEEYFALYEKNHEDPYLKCTCIQEQRAIDISDRLVEENNIEKKKKRNSKTNIKIYVGKIKIIYPKKYIKFNQDSYFQNLYYI